MKVQTWKPQTRETQIDSNSAMSKGKYVPVCKKHKPNMYSHVPVIVSVLGLPNVTTWDEIEKKMGSKKSKTYADKLAFASKHLHIAFADCICTLHLYIAFAACICKQAFAHCTCTLHLQAKVLIKTLLKVKQVENKQREKKPRFNKQFL
ncbi:hypothetical protein Tco_0658515 [Tanacetum coccineum]